MSAKESQGTNEDTCSSLFPSQQALLHSISSSGSCWFLIFNCYCQPLVFQLVVLFLGMNLLREAAMPIVSPPIWLFVLQSHIPRPHFAQELEGDPSNSSHFPGFHPGHTSDCSTNSLSCPLSVLQLAASPPPG